VKELIGAVQPEVVVVELCKDRVAGLVDEEEQPRVPDTWHIRCGRKGVGQGWLVQHSSGGQ
jgi:pheromone shutdown protein TraB